MISKKGVVAWLIMLMTVLCFSSPASVSAASFPDVSKSHRAYDEVMYLANKKILSGYTDGTFKPGSYVTRSEAASMIGRALHLKGGYRQTEYRDVPKGHYASGYIQDMSNDNILSGYGNGYFGVSDKLTREQMASILSRAWTFKETSNLSFTDVPKSSPTYVPINKLATAGIVGGYPNGKFGPKDYIMRADFALMLARVLNPEFRSKPAEPKPEPPPPPTTNPIAQAQVTADFLNVRTGPDASNSAVGMLRYGTMVDVYTKLSNGWAYVKGSSLTGYVHGGYLSYGTTTPVDPSNPLKGRIVVIDPGHGGTDPGALGYGLKEKDITLITSKLLRDYLEEAGAKVVMTRDTDIFHALEKRVTIANDANGEVFLSVHANAFNGSANGTETYYNEDNKKSADNKKLATFIQTRLLIPELEMNNRGVKEANFYVIKNQNKMASSLVELGFIDHKSDALKLASDTWRKKAAYQIHLGIKDYFTYLQNK
ncbi:N-acetylmuramoyl-L-alanine amidase [Fictibacillus halophilus]|uniref:N-acetylmuramoyl-L-alanine amidase n=1 Tax=Fictibacillus halophilus TaxID=1610490 RepID=A0ABV2LEF3_9BACL|nr:N-acetylmuramoyl-L-alanine amidase [Fictibacillus halophilus]